MKKILDMLVRLTAWLRRHHRLQTGPAPVKVNVGSGFCVAPGWINLDSGLHALFSKWPEAILRRLYRMSSYRQWYAEDDYVRLLREHRFHHHNVEHGMPFADETVDFVYSSHLLEHLFQEDAEAFTRECHRVLKTGGVLRICVPDLEHAVALYTRGQKEKALEYFFVKRDGYFDTHKFMYDHELLASLLKRVGFSRTEKRAYRVGATPDLETLDNRPEETLYVEAVK
jgi:predicted SAM-dependent methyltransferase